MIPPERLLRALLLQAFYTVRSERQLMEQLDYNLLFRWFVGLSTDDPVWDATVFCKNRDRLLDGDIAAKFFASVLTCRKSAASCPASTFPSTAPDQSLGHMKSFVPKAGRKPPSGNGRRRRGGRNTERDFHRGSAGTIRIARPPTPMPGCSAKPPAKRPSSATWGI